jgi:hypothetical protein
MFGGTIKVLKRCFIAMIIIAFISAATAHTILFAAIHDFFTLLTGHPTIHVPTPHLHSMSNLRNLRIRR